MIKIIPFLILFPSYSGAQSNFKELGNRVTVDNIYSTYFDDFGNINSIIEAVKDKDLIITLDKKYDPYWDENLLYYVIGQLGVSEEVKVYIFIREEFSPLDASSKQSTYFTVISENEISSPQFLFELKDSTDSKEAIFQITDKILEISGNINGKEQNLRLDNSTLELKQI